MSYFSKKTGARLFMSLAALFAVSTGQADVIEHIGERYIIHVDEMNLTGDETLLDVLMMCPEVVTLDGKAPVGSGLYGGYTVRVDNINVELNTEAFLRNTRASEVKKIKMCILPQVQKGSNGLKKVIDINLRKDNNGNEGKVALSGDTYGGASAYVSTMHKQDNLTLLGIATGNTLRSKNDAGVVSHDADEGFKAHASWDITSKDNLLLDLTQQYTRNHAAGADIEHSRYAHLHFVYTRTLSDAGAYALFEGQADYNSNSFGAEHVRATYPYALVETSFPLISHNFWVLAGLESGYTGETDVTEDYTNRSRYEDGYMQLDLKAGKWNFMIGDRFRVINFWQNDLKLGRDFEHSTSNHAYAVSVAHHFNANNTLQGSFSRRYYNAEFSDYLAEVAGSNPALEQIANGKVYTPDYDENIAYISELRYTYSKPDLVLSTLVQNIRQDLTVGHDNTLGLGVSAFWHKGVFRVNAGINYFWQKTTYSAENKQYNNFVNLKLAPQVALPSGWRFTSTLLYNSRKAYHSEYYTPANFYADVAVSKRLCKNWLIEGKYHDIAGQHTGNRAGTIGVTYFWGK